MYGNKKKGKTSDYIECLLISHVHKMWHLFNLAGQVYGYCKLCSLHSFCSWRHSLFVKPLLWTTWSIDILKKWRRLQWWFWFFILIFCILVFFLFYFTRFCFSYFLLQSYLKETQITEMYCYMYRWHCNHVKKEYWLQT